MRVTSTIFVSALLRRVFAQGSFGVVARRGHDEAGAIFLLVERSDGLCQLYEPAPQSAYDDAAPQERFWSLAFDGDWVPRAQADSKFMREQTRDADCWLVAIDDRQGRVFLDERLLVNVNPRV